MAPRQWSRFVALSVYISIAAKFEGIRGVLSRQKVLKSKPGNLQEQQRSVYNVFTRINCTLTSNIYLIKLYVFCFLFIYLVNTNYAQCTYKKSHVNERFLLA